MNKWLKRGLNTALFFAAFNTLEHFCHQQTEGFSLSRIQFHQTSPAPEDQNPALNAILNQPFHYLDCGNQCFAFTSQDGQYVLKFFKYVDHTAPAWTSKIPLLKKFKPFRPHRQKKIAWKRKRDFQGYQFAYDHFRQETGLLAIHLHPTSHAYPTIALHDKLNIVHSLDLNTTPFVLQQKASPIYPQFSAWLQNNDIDKTKHGIKSLISLCASRLSKNILDDDVHFYSNFGFIGETAIQIDPGHFILSKTPPPLDELKKLTVELKEWFANHYPPLVPYVENCLH